MADRPYFSIVIPTFNRANTILTTLQSVFDQVFTDFEVIIVDNKSTDQIEEVLKEHISAGTIKFLVNDKNYERSYSRNRGLGEAKGQFALLLDSDDLLYPSCLQDAYNYSIENSDIKLFHNLYEFVDENGKKSKGSDLYIASNPIKSICRGNFLACNGVFMADQLYNKHQFDDQAVGSEDWDYWLRVIAECGHLGRINKINSAIRIHDGRSMANLNFEKIEKTKKYILDKISKNPDKYSLFIPYLSFLRSSTYLFIASTANTCHKSTETFKYLRKALVTHFSVLFSKRFLIIFINGIFGILNIKKG